MFSGQYHVRKDSSNGGKFGHRPNATGHRPAQHLYKKHPYEIISRQIGLTVKRTVYSVTIHGEQGERLNFINDIASAVAARKSAEAWIDSAIRRRPRPARSPLSKHLPLPTRRDEQQVQPTGNTPRAKQ